MTTIRIAFAWLAARVLPLPASPQRALPPPYPYPHPAVSVTRHDAARLAARRERLAWQAARDALAASLLHEAHAARARSESCPRSHQDAWLERMSTLMDCARRVRDLRPSDEVAP